MRKIINSILLTAILLILPLSVSFGALTMSAPVQMITGHVATFSTTICMTESKTLIVFSDYTDGIVKAVLATETNGTLTMSKPKNMVIDGFSSSQESRSTRLTNTQAVVTFRHNTTYHGNMVLITINQDDSLTISDPIVVTTYTLSGMTYPTKMTDSRLIYTYFSNESGNTGYRMGLIGFDGTNLTLMSEDLIESCSSTSYSEIPTTRMTDNIAMSIYCYSSTTKGIAIKLNNDALSVVSSKTVSEYYYGGYRMISLSESVAMISFGDEVRSKIKIGTLTLSGETVANNIIFASDVVAGNIFRISLKKIANNVGILSLCLASDKYGKSYLCTYDSGAINVDSPVYFTTPQSNNSYLSSDSLANGKAIITFYDGGNNGYGNAIIANTSSTPPSDYSNKVNGVDILKINGVTPAKINGI